MSVRRSRIIPNFLCPLECTRIAWPRCLRWLISPPITLSQLFNLLVLDHINIVSVMLLDSPLWRELTETFGPPFYEPFVLFSKHRPRHETMRCNVELDVW